MRHFNVVFICFGAIGVAVALAGKRDTIEDFEGGLVESSAKLQDGAKHAANVLREDLANLRPKRGVQDDIGDAQDKLSDLGDQAQDQADALKQGAQNAAADAQDQGQEAAGGIKGKIQGGISDLKDHGEQLAHDADKLAKHAEKTVNQGISDAKSKAQDALDTAKDKLDEAHSGVSGFFGNLKEKFGRK